MARAKGETIPFVLDSSAILAAVFEEPGAEPVWEYAAEAAISAVNWSEILQKVGQRGVSSIWVKSRFTRLGLAIIPFSPEDAEATAALWPRSKPIGLSLGDRACLALGSRLGRAVVTADRRGRPWTWA